MNALYTPTTTIASVKDAYDILDAGGVIFTRSWNIFIKKRYGNLLRSKTGTRWLRTNAKLYNHCLYWATEPVAPEAVAAAPKPHSATIVTTGVHKARLLRKQKKQIRKECSDKIKEIDLEIARLLDPNNINKEDNHE